MQSFCRGAICPAATYLRPYWCCPPFFFFCLETSADYKNYTPAELVAIFSTGARVVRGPDWRYGTQDRSGPGTIVQGLGSYSKPNYVQVAWDYARATFYEYRVGNGFFDVQLYAGLPSFAVTIVLSRPKGVFLFFSFMICSFLIHSFHVIWI